MQIRDVRELISFKGQAWRHDAVCAEVGDYPFYSQDPRDRKKAKRICKSCPVIQECLDDAIAFDEPIGIRGGLTRKERLRIVAPG